MKRKRLPLSILVIILVLFTSFPVFAISPTGFIDSTNTWGPEANAYDGNVATYSDSTGIAPGHWGGFVEFTAPPILTSGIRVRATGHWSTVNRIDVDVYDAGIAAWYGVYEGTSWNTSTWNNWVFDHDRTITSIRLRFQNMFGATVARGARIYEIDITESGTPVVGSLIPTANNTYNLGSPTNEWKNVYANTANVSGKLNVGGFSPFGFLGSSAQVIASNANVLQRGYGNFLHWLGFNVWVCDGTADDVEIQAAIGINSRVVLSEGTFTLASTLVGASGLTLEGQGWSTIIILANGVNDDIFYAGSKPYITIRNLKLDGNKSNQGVGGNSLIFLQWSPSALVENVWAVNGKNSGIFNSAANNIGTSNFTIIRNNLIDNMDTTSIALDWHQNNIHIEGNTVKNSGGDGILLNALAAMTGVWIEGNNVDNTMNHAIQLEGTVASTDVHINNNLVNTTTDATKGFGIGLQGTGWFNATVEIMGNHIKNTKLDAFSIGGMTKLTIIGNLAESVVGNPATGGDGFAFADSGLEVDGLICVGNTSINNYSKGFMFYRVKNSVISGNYVAGNGSSGFYFRGGQNNQVIGNHGQGNLGEGGLMLWDDLEGIPEGSIRNIIEGNQFNGNTGTGIQEAGLADYNLIINNHVVGNSVAQITKVGGNSVISRNMGYVTENSGVSVGTGAQQTKAHGLNYTPLRQNIGVFSDNITAGVWQTAVPDATNIYVTCNVSGSAWHWATVGK